MQNTSTVGIPKNCMNWLVLGLTIYTDTEIKDALKEHFGLSDRNKMKGRVDASSTDAVNGSQLHAAYDAINTMGENFDKALDAQQQFNTAVHNTLANHKDAIKNNTQRIEQHDRLFQIW